MYVYQMETYHSNVLTIKIATKPPCCVMERSIVLKTKKKNIKKYDESLFHALLQVLEFECYIYDAIEYKNKSTQQTNKNRYCFSVEEIQTISHNFEIRNMKSKQEVFMTYLCTHTHTQLHTYVHMSNRQQFLSSFQCFPKRVSCCNNKMTSCGIVATAKHRFYGR